MKKQVQKGMVVILTVCIVLLSSAALGAECKIEVISESSLPGENLIKNPGFEEGASPQIWEYYRSKSDWSEELGFSEKDGVTDKEKHSGEYSFKLTGERGVNKGLRQGRVGPIEFHPPIPAGTPITISAWSKSSRVNAEGGDYLLSCHVSYADGTSSYFPAPRFPKMSHDWMKVTTRGITEKKVKLINWVYICYYDQEGEIFFDDIFLVVGKTNLTYKVECPNIKNVNLYSEEKGLLRGSGVLPHGTNIYAYTEEVDILDNYCVEVEDYSGKKFLKNYPETILKETGKEIPVFQRFDSEIFKIGEERPYEVILPKVNGKKVILELKARLDYENIAGYNTGFKILFNNTDLKVERLIDRKETFTFADGRINNTYYGDGFATYYSPNFAPIPEDSGYYPVDIPGHDPYLFKFEVSDLVKEGVNTVVIKYNALKVENPLIIKDVMIKSE